MVTNTVVLLLDSLPLYFLEGFSMDKNGQKINYLHAFQVRKVSWWNLMFSLNGCKSVSKFVDQFFLFSVFTKHRGHFLLQVTNYVCMYLQIDKVTDLLTWMGSTSPSTTLVSVRWDQTMPAPGESFHKYLVGLLGRGV